jgi:HD-like signal output (HDOD) protein
MSELTAQNQIVTEAIKQISHIATLPEITVKIIELVEDPTSTAQDLNNVISNDPALCSRILKVVNSSFYGLPGQIGSINRAIVLLGLNAVKNIAISASMAKLFRGGQLCDKFNAREIWLHAIATAAGSKLIADKLKMGVGDEAFLAGLTHDIGMMVEMQFDRTKLAEVVNQIVVDHDGVPETDMRSIERAVFGADHQAFGKALCERWKFPEAFAQVSGHHHNPLDLPTGSRSMACLVHIADHLAATLPGAFRLDLPSLEIDGSILDEIRLSREALADISSRLEEEVEDVAAMLA